MPVIQQIKKYPSRVWKSLALYSSLVTLGLSLGVAGPTMLDLGILVQDDENIAYILPGRAGGYAVGSFLGGILYNFMNIQLMMSICMFLSTILTFGLVMNRSLGGLVATFCINGVCLGMIEAGSNMFLIHIWGKENPPFMQALHFSFGLGAFVAPLIAKPFLLEHPPEERTKEWKNDIDSHETSYGKNDSLNGNNYNITTTMMNSVMSSIPAIEGMDSSSAAISNSSSSISRQEKTNYAPENVKLIYTYGIIGIYMAINAIIFMYLYINHRETAPHPSRCVLVPEAEGTASGTSIKNTASNHCREGSNGEQKSLTSSRVTYSKSDSGKRVDLPPFCSEVKRDDDVSKSINTTQPINGCAKTSSLAPSFVETSGEENQTTAGEENQTTGGEKNETKERKTGGIKLLVTILTAFFMHFYCGLEITFGSFLTTYAVHSNLQLSKTTGALLTSCFWATFTFFRLFAVFYIDFTGPELNLVFELALILIANIFLLVWGNSALWGLWTGTALLGLGTSSVWASVFGYIEPYIPVTSGMTASFITAACLGEFIIPAIISSFIETEPRVFLWVTLYCSLAITLLFAIVTTICRKYFKKVDKS